MGSLIGIARWCAYSGALTCLLLAAAPARAASHAGSDEEQRACTPDVFRLCTSAIPDEEAIVACLKSKRTLLSPACAAVFAEGTGAVPAPRRRAK